MALVVLVVAWAAGTYPYHPLSPMFSHPCSLIQLVGLDGMIVPGAGAVGRPLLD